MPEAVLLPQACPSHLQHASAVRWLGACKHVG